MDPTDHCALSGMSIWFDRVICRQLEVALILRRCERRRWWGDTLLLANNAREVSQTVALAYFLFSFRWHYVQVNSLMNDISLFFLSFSVLYIVRCLSLSLSSPGGRYTPCPLLTIVDLSLSLSQSMQAKNEYCSNQHNHVRSRRLYSCRRRRRSRRARRYTLLSFLFSLALAPFSLSHSIHAQEKRTWLNWIIPYLVHYTQQRTRARISNRKKNTEMVKRFLWYLIANKKRLIKWSNQ